MRRTRRHDDGANLVEFALIMPILALFLFGIVEFGIAFDAKQSINSAAREGARTAAIPTNSFSDVDTATRNAYEGLSTDGDITVTVENSATSYSAQRVGTSAATGDAASNPCDDFNSVPAEGTSVVVTAEIGHEITIPFFGVLDRTLKGRGEFRCERSV